MPGFTMSDKPMDATNLNKDTMPKAMDAQGSIGKQFTEQGAIGSMGQKIGGPFDKKGMIGKQFTPEGSIGGAVQNAMGGEKKAKE
ncbi:hypothetical protein LCI18_002819 [Fusarium solani-melongenae]|uniref:Uncharacterized protein n=1 Tax=Fusarium solani subsp. cucurbitae TaxID=2747967 RepID=A0ACD3YSG5_FUSSC|nr:hypothetical protein LCI18_002819 [Fusarium solani-melongenae]